MSSSNNVIVVILELGFVKELFYRVVEEESELCLLMEFFKV